MKVFPLLLCCCAAACAQSDWTLARSEHFDVYSQTGETNARTAAGWFEQLHAFFSSQFNLDSSARPRVRVIGFAAPEEFRRYSSRTSSDAYYVGTESQDYIVMSRLGADQLTVAAHEYGHVLVHSSGLMLPPWMNEGLAEFLSSVRINGAVTTLGADLPLRSRTLKRPWMPLQDLFSMPADSPLRHDRDTAALFYAESWALVHMLVMSPAYNARFAEFAAAVSGDASSGEAFAKLYGRSIDAVEKDVREWMRSPRLPMRIPSVAAAQTEMELKAVAPLQFQLVVAELAFASGELDRAERLCRDVSRRTPPVPEAYALLGSIDLRRGNVEAARREWRRAMELGIDDASLCYRFATVGNDEGVDKEEVREALQRAVALRPDFDDAQYALGLLDMNTGRFDSAAAHFRAIKKIAPGRAYGYWSALAYTLTEIDERDDAKKAAAEAAKYASTSEEHAHASTLAYVADTDLAVQFTRDAQGRMQLSTARSPHAEQSWNPFIEPGDHIVRVDVLLDEIQCDAGTARVAVIGSGGRLIVAIPDLRHVQMRNAPSEFTCGRQAPRRVRVEYAASDELKGAAGIVRGIEFK